MIFGKHINRYYLRYAPMLLLGLAALVLVDYAQLLVPAFYRTVVNGMNGTDPGFTMEVLLEDICRPMLFVLLAMVVGRFAWRVCFFGSAIRVEANLRLRMFDHCKDLSQSYYQTNKVGNLMSLFTNDIETVQECFGWGVMMFCDAIFLGSLALSKMFKMNVLLSCLTLIPLTLLLVGGVVVSKFLALKWERRQETFSALSDFAQESFSGIAVVKAFVKETRELLAFRKLNKTSEEANVDFTRLSTLMHILVTLLVESVVGVILGYGGYLVHEGVFNAGELMEFIGYFTEIVWPVMAVSELIDMRSRGKASLKRISELLDSPVDVCDKSDVTALSDVRGAIAFKDLTFRYPGAGYDALKHLSLSIAPGEFVGVIGKTGSGKTTLVDLILRTYNVPEGTLFIDGHDVCACSIESVRAACAYVPQDNFLFSDTVANNIAFATDGATEREIEDAAMLAAVHTNIEAFRDKYKTALGERGVTVSGGQKQRISIARALLKNAPILLLDDSVSAVDTKTERAILSNLRRTRKGKTTILIAHRISTIESADKILFLDDGVLVDAGTHAELYARTPAYRTMVDLQKLEDEKAGDDHA